MDQLVFPVAALAGALLRSSESVERLLADCESCNILHRLVSHRIWWWVESGFKVVGSCGLQPGTMVRPRRLSCK